MNDGDERDNFLLSRKLMLNDLEARGIRDERVLRAMGEIAREKFLPAELWPQAYSDGPLPINCHQTISQPYIVALMTQELRVKPEMDVLEIGTGSGYQTAILSKLAKRVYTIDRFEKLSHSAQAVLKELGVDNVEFCVGDGSCGWSTERTFERIIVTAALPKVGEPLTGQLATGGIMIAPVGGPNVQRLYAYEKDKDGKIMERFICDVRFVRVVGKYGFDE
ncbi:MAG: protein-L-isoaspartate(D-aspartate) O-methyltransferase [Phycisphaerae bacterium]|jgi:protein-L-isoaspartate(D-aspartate) O-methyltransferase